MTDLPKKSKAICPDCGLQETKLEQIDHMVEGTLLVKGLNVYKCVKCNKVVSIPHAEVYKIQAARQNKDAIKRL